MLNQGMLILEVKCKNFSFFFTHYKADFSFLYKLLLVEIILLLFFKELATKFQVSQHFFMLERPD
jgi:hypothetical protein